MPTEPDDEYPPLIIDLASAPRPSGGQGAPGNTMFFAAQREGAVLVGGFDNHWEQIAYISKLENGSVENSRVPLVARANAYAEHFTVGSFQGNALFAYRLGQDQIVLQYEHGEGPWRARTIESRLDQSPTSGFLHYFPTISASARDVYLGVAQYSVANGQGAYRAYRLTGTVAGDQTVSKSVNADIAHEVAGDLSASGDRFAIAMTTRPGVVSFFEAGWTDAWSPSPVYSLPAPGGTTTHIDITIVHSAEGVAHILLLPRPDRILLGAEPHPVYVARAPDWEWMDTGARATDLMGAAFPDGMLAFAARTGLEEWSFFSVDEDLRGVPVFTASCPIRPVYQSGLPEALVFVYDSQERLYRLRLVTDVHALGDADPCLLEGDLRG